MKQLDTLFFTRDTVTVARELLGKKLLSTINGQMIGGIISETEAYGSFNDPASHAFRGITKRNEAMFGPSGHAYVYFIYGNHFCFNIVAKAPDAIAGAVLIRGIIPTDGLTAMQRNRKNTPSLKNLANGPGKVCQALGITKQCDKQSLGTTTSSLVVLDRHIDMDIHYIQTSRIGISKGQELHWRFLLCDN
jgi:DNA-3-methyladenine glycosylase